MAISSLLADEPHLSGKAGWQRSSLTHDGKKRHTVKLSPLAD
jgi:hypothetical protein